MARVLIVEDSPTQAHQLAILLEDAGFSVAHAPDAEAAFARLGREIFDVVLSDLLLPGDSGFDLCRRIKADPRLREIPVIVLTSQADPVNVLRGLEAGANDFMTKDRDPAQIVGRLQRLARTLRTPAAATTPWDQVRVGFLDEEFELAVSKEQLLNVLLSAFEDLVHLNRQHEQNLVALQKLSDQLRESVRSEQQTLAAFKRSQSQLVQAEKLASLVKMVAGIAHEVNNPLTFTRTNVSVLERDTGALRDLLDLYREADDVIASQRPELHEKIAGFADEIDLAYTMGNLKGLMGRTFEGLLRIEKIVKGLRDFARLDESALKEADLNTGIVSTLDLLRSDADRAGVRFEARLAPLPLVTCYPAKINQVVFNLVSNALDACRPGGVVTVSTAVREGRVEVEVADTGAGIDPLVRDKIFDPFFTTKPPGKGAGLGLSISYGIVQEHGGSVSVESTLGHGSRFIVALPLRCPGAGSKIPTDTARPHPAVVPVISA